MKHNLLFILIVFFLSSMVYAQKDTVDVPGYYSTTTYGTLNEAVDAARENGTISNTVFKLEPYEVYVLSRSIFLDPGQNLDIVAPKPLRAGEGTSEEVQNSAPPQIVWTEEAIARDYVIQTYGDVILKNVWVRFCDFTGGVVQTSITFEDSVALGDKESGRFEGCIFDYNGIGSEGSGTISVKADHFTGIFKNCYFRNQSDAHFQYYGRAVSFPYQSAHFHYDSLLFENCSFSNLGRIVMQEGNEFGSNVHINHCTLINSIEWVYQSAGWLENTAITNSIFVNPYLYSYRPADVCPDSLNGVAYTDKEIMDMFNSGECNNPGGGLINGITAVDSFGFTEYVDFTDQDRGLYIAHDAYMYQAWMVDWFANNPSALQLHHDRHDSEIRLMSPMIGEDALAFIDSVDGDGNKVFPHLNVDWETIYSEDPDFIVPPTNEDTLKLFIEGKWYTGLDIDWSYDPYAGFAQKWPLPENMAYNNTAYQTAAMGGFPLGDLNWYPDQLPVWEDQRDQEWLDINEMLSGPGSIKEVPGVVPADYVLRQNYPNPFNPTTHIEYSIPAAGHVSLKVYNTLGQLVATLQNGDQRAGKYVATFDAKNLASGVYIYKLQADNVSIAKKFTLLK